MEEVEIYLRSLDSRIKEDLERRRDVKRLAQKKFGAVQQLTLPLTVPSSVEKKIAPDSGDESDFRTCALRMESDAGMTART